LNVERKTGKARGGSGEIASIVRGGEAVAREIHGRSVPISQCEFAIKLSRFSVHAIFSKNQLRPNPVRHAVRATDKYGAMSHWRDSKLPRTLRAWPKNSTDNPMIHRR
jgi:hypothetical protein